MAQYLGETTVQSIKWMVGERNGTGKSVSLHGIAGAVDRDHIRVDEIEMALEGEQREQVDQTETTLNNKQQHFTQL